MKQSIGHVTLVVRDYDEALAFYVGTLGFRLIEDTFIEAQNKRWVVVEPPGSTGCQLLLARAVGEEQASRIGNQTGGRVLRIYGLREEFSAAPPAGESRPRADQGCGGAQTCAKPPSTVTSEPVM